MRWDNKGIILVCLLLLPLLSGLVLASDPIYTSRPLINLTFHEEPVNLISHVLNYDPILSTLPDQFSNVLATVPSGTGFHEFIFSFDGSNGALFDGTYTFTAEFEDEDFNVQSIDVNFEVSTGNMPLWLVNPSNQYLFESTVGASQSKENVLLDIGYDSLYHPADNIEECRVGFEPLNFDPNNLGFEFNRLPNTMQILPDKFSFSPLNFPLTLLENEEISLHVICKEDPVQSAIKYHHGPFTLSYDETNPQVTTFFSVDPIIDWNHRSSELTISTDDRTVCSVENVLYPQGLYHPISGSDLFLFDSYDDFVTLRTIELGFFGTFNNGVQEPLITALGEHYYEFKVTCENLAGRVTTESIGLTIDLQTEIFFEALNYQQYQSDDSFDLDILTNIEALSCVVVEESGQSYQMVRDSTNTLLWTHGFTNLLEGSHNFDVVCSASDTSHTETYNYFVDLTEPELPVIISPANVCGDDSFTVSYYSDTLGGSPISNYTVELKEGSTVLYSNTLSATDITFSPDALGMSFGSTYVLSVMATDMARWDSTVATANIGYNEPLSSSCDVIPPLTGYELNSASNGYDVTLYCLDGESDCQSSFNLYTSTSSITCPDFGQYSPNTMNFVNNRWEYTFFVDESQIICWQVFDNGGSSADDKVFVSADVGIELVEPLFGVAPDKVFDFSVSTIEDAICKQAGWNDGYSSDPTVLFNQIQNIPPAGEFTVTGGLIHTIPSFSGLSTSLLDEDSFEWVVVCKAGDLYDAFFFDLGFDTTDPVLSIDANPNPLLQSPFVSDLSVSSDDAILCEYTDYVGVNGHFYPSSPDYTDEGFYSSSDLVKQIPDEFGFITTSYAEYTYSLACTNLAGRVSVEDYIVTVDPQNSLWMEINMFDSYGSSPVIVNASTLLDAQCNYNVYDTASSLVSSGSLNSNLVDGTYVHSSSVNLGDGMYDVVIDCSYPQGPYSALASESFILDATAPSVPVITITPEFTCNPDFAPTIEFYSTDASSVSYEYAITYPDGSVDTQVTSGNSASVPLPLLEGSYGVSVFAVDSFGHTSSSASSSFSLLDPSSTSCDQTPPRTGIELTPISNGYDVTIFCEDDHSGCATTYYLYRSPSVFSCPDYGAYTSSSLTFTNGRYEETIFLDETEQLCWYVFDNANLNASSSSVVSASIGIELVTPSFGVAPTKTFDFSVSTALDATCKQAKWSDSYSSDPSVLFDEIPEIGASGTFDVTGGLLHSINSYDGIANALLDEEEFAWVVVCKSDEFYDVLYFDLGFDISVPNVIDISSLPNPVLLPPYYTDFSLEVDDPSICVYTDFAGNNGHFYASDPDYAELSYYMSDPFLKRLPDSGTFPGVGFTEYTYDFTCTNLAGLETSVSHVITLDPQNDLTMEIVMDASYDQTPVEIKAHTLLEADCTYDVFDNFDVSVDQGSLSRGFENPNYVHTSSVSLSDGDFKVVVDCSYPQGPFFGRMDHQFSLDSSAPSVPVITITPQTSCDASNSPTIEFYSVDTNAIVYEYTITDPLGVSSSGSTPHTFISLSTPLIVGDYTIDVVAKDTFGHSSSSSAVFTLLEESSPLCDEISPLTGYDLNPRPDGFEITIYCEDTQSGCQNTFSLYRSTTDVVCPASSSYTSENFANVGIDRNDITYFVTEDELFCWEVFDNAGLSSDDSTIVSAEINIAVEEPSFGIAPTKVFDFAVSTALFSTCRHDRYSTSYSTDPETLYNQIPLSNEFSTSDGYYHSISSFSGLSSSPEESGAWEWIISCKSEERYDYIITDIGYDTTDPIITVGFDPQPILRPPYTAQVNLDVSDEALCTYVDYNSDVGHFYDEFPLVTEREFYVFSPFSKQLPDVGSFPGTTYTTYDYTFTCTNLAGRSSSEIASIILDPQNDLVMSITMQSTYTQNPVSIEANTQLDAVCVYEVFDSDALSVGSGSMSSAFVGGEYVHTASNSLPDGDLDVVVDCSYDAGPFYARESHSFTLDTLAPSTPLISFSNDLTCSLNTPVLVSFASNDTSSIIFEYSITAPNGNVQQGTLTNSNSILAQISEAGVYSVFVRAVDSFGLSSESTSSFEVREESHPACDSIAPIGSISERNAAEGIYVSVLCSDPSPGSGCFDTYYYSLVDPLDASCLSATYNDQDTLGSEILITDLQRICYRVLDNAQPDAHEYNGTHVISAGLYIELLEPYFAVSPTKSFRLEFGTQKDATCRHGEYLSSYDSLNDQQRYNLLVGKGSVSEFGETGGVSHVINDFNDLLRNDDEYSDEWLVACESFDGVFKSEKFVLGYDVSVPIITADALPNPLIEPTQASTQLSMTLDDESLCTHVQPIISPYGSSPQVYHYYDPTSDPANRDHYTDSYATRLPEDDLLFFVTSTYTVYSYTADCTNLAGLSSSQGFDIVIDPANDLAVTINTPIGVTSTNVLIDVSTVLEATCEYSVDGLPFESLNSNNNVDHTVSRFLPEGDHTLAVSCTSIYSNQLSGSASSTIFVDSQSPSGVTIVANSPTCSLDDPINVRFSASDTGSGLSYYEYELSISGTFVDTYTTTSDVFDLPVQLPLQLGAEYEIRARAYDLSGNSGPFSSLYSIEASDDQHPGCDFVNPLGWANVNHNQNGADVNIFCSDDESGCSDVFRYAVVAQGETCDSGFYSTKSYSDSISVFSDQVVCYEVEDNAGNKFSSFVDVSVSLDIGLSEPVFGIGNSLTYDLVFATDRAAQCRFGFISPNSPSNLEDWYNQLSPSSFTSSNGVTHSANNFNIINFGASACTGLDECEVPMVVICNENSRYHYNVFSIGYDVSSPSLTTLISPNPVIEPQNLQATLFVDSDDDVWCTYEDVATGISYGFYQNPDITNRDQYDTHLEQFLGYFSPPTPPASSYTVNYEVTCVNLAQTSVSENRAVVISPTNEVGLSILNDASYNTRSIVIEATTDLASQCTYKFDPNHPATTFSTTGGTTHSSSYSFYDDGAYELIVSCNAVSGPFAATQTHSMIVDSTGPSMVSILASDFSCNVNSLDATLIGDGDVIGIDYYNYSIYGLGGLVVDWKSVDAQGSVDLSENFSFNLNEQYTWQAQVVDNFGRASSILSKTIIAADETHPNCDFVNPVASASVTPVYGGVDVSVSCSDDGSGCTTYYDYVYDGSTVCPGNYGTQYYSTGAIFEDQTGISCYRVYDNAALTDEGSVTYDIISTCSNGIQDPDEDGVDCGGVCPANCGTCSNGVWDVDEDGIDCGGVCPNSCLFTCGNGVVNPGEECDGSTNGLTCDDFGFLGGTLSCDSSCQFDTGLCNSNGGGFCGDGIVSIGEECDGGTNGLTCGDFGYDYGNLFCASDCTFDVTSCQINTGATCGNGVIEFGEECDGSTNGLTCGDFGFLGGTLSCSSSCEFDTNSCTTNGGGFCGDGIINLGEECDGSTNGLSCSDFGYTGGSLFCGSDCSFDIGSCTTGNGGGTCGDGVVNLGEECDGGTNGLSCSDFGYVGGNLACGSDCSFDVSSCSTGGGFCGDGIINLGEECDGSTHGLTCGDFGYANGSLFCGSDCSFDVSSCDVGGGFCGDGIINLGEECDGSTHGLTCGDFGYTGGSLSCGSDCSFDIGSCTTGNGGGTCGDGVLNLGEECDGSTNGLTCGDFGYAGGNLACGSDCSFDVSSCSAGGGFCGDGIISLGEECDGSTHGLTCGDFGYAGGNLACGSDCSFDVSSCNTGNGGFCGDGVVNIGEECDGSTNGLTCGDFGFLGGTLFCNSACSLETSGCFFSNSVCGNGIIESGEECDGSTNGLSCSDFGYTGGSLSCGSDCNFNVNSCTTSNGGFCGDGIIDIGEECDGGTNGLTCSDFGYTSGSLSCGSDCSFDVGSCDLGGGSFCGDGIINLDEECDGSTNGLSCSDFGYTGGSLTCGGDCSFDVNSCTTGNGGGTCGDGVLNLGEECDGSTHGLTCGDFGYAGGNLACGSDCSFDVSSCSNGGGGFCGDGIIDLGEECDGSTHGLSCVDFGYNGGSLSCGSDCSFDVGLCSIGNGGVCGNGILDFGEECDGFVNGLTCGDFGYASGSLSCGSDCSFDVSSCTAGNGGGVCGDGVLNLGEDCDGSTNGLSCNDFGYAGGSLSCGGDCSFDVTSCNNNGGNGFCGDGVISLGEECDGSTNGLSCSDFGFNGGSLFCSSSCEFDVNSCVVNSGGFCGDGVIDTGEECDGSTNGLTCGDFGYTSGSLSCGSDCSFDVGSCSTGNGNGFCGDGVLNLGEECDGSLNGLTCNDFGFDTGFLMCSSDCSFDVGSCVVTTSGFCGDGILDTGEDCDGNVNGLTCGDFGFSSGSLSCGNDCSFDVSSCDIAVGSFCGDGIVNVDEECDGGVGGLTCSDFGYDLGSLGCSSSCEFDVSSCDFTVGSFCGDGIINAGEECDGGVNGLVCSDFGYSSGTLFCGSDCSFDVSSCSTGSGGGVCGDGVINLGEDCDGSVNGLSCGDFGFSFGDLLCSNDCSFNTSLCGTSSGGVCGDNSLDIGEDCDGDTAGLFCEDFGLISGSLFCSNSCDFDTGSCLSNTGSCGNGILDSGEDCDGSVNGLTCGDFGFFGGSLSCSSSCDFNVSLCQSDTGGFCGDGQIDFYEECDGDTNGLTCNDLGFSGGDLACDSTCSIDTDSCIDTSQAVCGDGVIDIGEECDGGVEDLTCGDFGLSGSGLSCSSECKIDTTSCEGPVGFCGDGVIGTGESCDGTFLELSCEDFDFTSGELSCDSCAIDTSACYSGSCGDGNIDPGESCDGINWGGVFSCSDLSDDFVAGMPSCGLDCHFDTNDCILSDDGEQSYDFCSSDIDCEFGQECLEGYCADIDFGSGSGNSGSDVDGDGLPDWWEEEYFGCVDCANADEDEDGDGVSNLEEYQGLTDPLDENSVPEGKGGISLTALILLITGLVFILGGTGYLVYDAYFAPKKSRGPRGGDNFNTGFDEPEVSFEDMEMQREDARRKRKEHDEAEKKRKAELARKLALQHEVKEKRDLEKQKQRDALFSEFKPEDKKSRESSGIGTKLDGKGTQKSAKTLASKKVGTLKGDSNANVVKDSSEGKKSKDGIKKGKASSKNKVKSSIATKKKSASFKKLDELTKDKKNAFDSLSGLVPKNQKEAFEALSSISGSSKNKVKETINDPHTTHKHISGLFDEAKKGNVTPKTVTPVLKHLVDKGKIDPKVAHKTVDALAKKELLTDNQKEKIKKDLA